MGFFRKNDLFQMINPKTSRIFGPEIFLNRVWGLDNFFDRGLVFSVIARVLGKFKKYYYGIFSNNKLFRYVQEIGFFGFLFGDFFTVEFCF